MALDFTITPQGQKEEDYLNMVLKKLEQHKAGRSGGWTFPCTVCGQIWPCDALKAKAVLDGTGMIG